MNNSRNQPNYNLSSGTPVLQIPELEPKFGIQMFSNSLPVLLGNLNQALVLQQLHFWLYNKYGVVIDGVRWIWKSVSEWVKDGLPSFTARKLYCALQALVDSGIVIREQLHKEHFGNNYDPRNRTYYYRINYEKFNQLITEKLKSLGIEFSQTPSNENNKSDETDSQNVTYKNKESVSQSTNPVSQNDEERFNKTDKPKQSKHQYRHQYRHIEESSTKDSTDDSSQRKSLDHLSSESRDRQTFSSVNTLDPEVISSEAVVRDKNGHIKRLGKPQTACPPLRVTRESSNSGGKPPHAFHSECIRYGSSGKNELVRNGHIKLRSQAPQSCPPKQYDRNLQINSPKEQKNVQQHGHIKRLGKPQTACPRFNKIPDGVWMIDGKLDVNFQDWLAEKWVKDYGIDIYEARANVRSHFRDEFNVANRWIQYQEETKHRCSVVGQRLANGVEIEADEQKMIVGRSRAVTEELPEEMNFVSSRDSYVNYDSNLLLAAHDGHDQEKNAGLLNQRLGSKDRITHQLNSISSDNSKSDEQLPSHRRLVNIQLDSQNNSTEVNTPQQTQPEPPKNDQGLAENSTAYEVYKPETVENPVDKKSLAETFRKNFAHLCQTKTMPKPEQSTAGRRVDTNNIKELNTLLGEDLIIRQALTAQLKRDERYDCHFDESGYVLYVEHAF